jgi:hypothetical protein
MRVHTAHLSPSKKKIGLLFHWMNSLVIAQDLRILFNNFKQEMTTVSSHLPGFLTMM